MEDWRAIVNDKSKYQAYLCSREWSVLTRKVRDRSGGRCERCKVNKHESTHHLTYERKYKERLEDLLGICNDCHSFIHGKSDYDPSVRPPIVNRKVVQSFYLAGKITGTTWRDQIVPGWSEENHSMNYYEAVDLADDTPFSWNSVGVKIQNRKSIVYYNGPWWLSDIDFGGHGVSQYTDGPHAAPEGLDARFGSDICATNQEITAFRVHNAIKDSDLIFAWVDRDDCFGTLFEIGLAAGLRKTIVFASPPSFDASDLWLPIFFSHYHVLAPSPLLAWNAFWEREDIISRPLPVGCREKIVAANREVQR